MSQIQKSKKKIKFSKLRLRSETITPRKLRSPHTKEKISSYFLKISTQHGRNAHSESSLAYLKNFSSVSETPLQTRQDLDSQECTTSDVEDNFINPKRIKPIKPREQNTEKLAQINTKNKKSKRAKFTFDEYNAPSSSDVNTEHLHVALAMSKSIEDLENPASADGYIPSTQEKIKKTLEEFGFSCNKSQTEFTELLSNRTEEERQKRIEEKVSQILNNIEIFNNNVNTLQQNQREQFLNHKPTSFLLRDSYDPNASLYQKHKLSISEMHTSIFYNKTVEPINAKVGNLLRDWNKIPGRERTPPLIQSPQASDTEVATINLYAEKVDENTTNNIPVRKSISPDLFTDEDCANTSICHRSDEPPANETPAKDVGVSLKTSESESESISLISSLSPRQIKKELARARKLSTPTATLISDCESVSLLDTISPRKYKNTSPETQKNNNSECSDAFQENQACDKECSEQLSSPKKSNKSKPNIDEATVMHYSQKSKKKNRIVCKKLFERNETCDEENSTINKSDNLSSPDKSKSNLDKSEIIRNKKKTRKRGRSVCGNVFEENQSCDESLVNKSLNFSPEKNTDTSKPNIDDSEIVQNKKKKLSVCENVFEENESCDEESLVNKSVNFSPEKSTDKSESYLDESENSHYKHKNKKSRFVCENNFEFLMNKSINFSPEKSTDKSKSNMDESEITHYEIYEECDNINNSYICDSSNDSLKLRHNKVEVCGKLPVENIANDSMLTSTDKEKHMCSKFSYTRSIVESINVEKNASDENSECSLLSTLTLDPNLLAKQIDNRDEVIDLTQTSQNSEKNADTFSTKQNNLDRNNKDFSGDRINNADYSPNHDSFDVFENQKMYEYLNKTPRKNFNEGKNKLLIPESDTNYCKSDADQGEVDKIDKEEIKLVEPEKSEYDAVCISEDGKSSVPSPKTNTFSKPLLTDFDSSDEFNSLVSKYTRSEHKQIPKYNGPVYLNKENENLSETELFPTKNKLRIRNPASEIEIVISDDEVNNPRTTNATNTAPNDKSPVPDTSKNSSRYSNQSNTVLNLSYDKIEISDDDLNYSPGTQHTSKTSQISIELSQSYPNKQMHADNNLRDETDAEIKSQKSPDVSQLYEENINKSSYLANVRYLSQSSIDSSSDISDEELNYSSAAAYKLTENHTFDSEVEFQKHLRIQKLISNLDHFPNVDINRTECRTTSPSCSKNVTPPTTKKRFPITDQSTPKLLSKTLSEPIFTPTKNKICTALQKNASVNDIENKVCEGGTDDEILQALENRNDSTATPHKQVIVKTRNITPIPNYSDMDTPRRNKELEKFGLKPMKRVKGVRMLRYIYEATHPVSNYTNEKTRESNSEDEDNRRVKRRKKNSGGGTTIRLNNEASHIRYNSTSDLNCSNDNIEIVGDKIAECEPLEKMIFERKQSSKIASCRLPLHIAWHNFVTSDPKIRESILLYEPVYLENIRAKLKSLGFKYHVEDLVTFLDSKCITIRTVQFNEKRQV